MHIETLAVCHNRVDKTTRALSSLTALKVSGCTFSHNLVDDGSTDGTVKKVNDIFPSVSIIKGNGKLYWAGGMRFGWDNFVSNKKFDFLIVYNDDCDFYVKEIERFLTNVMKGVGSNSIIVGALKEPRFNRVSYGGRSIKSILHPLSSKLIEPNGSYQKVDIFNMNFVIIPRIVLDEIGFLKSYFIHSQADFEFSARAKKKGYDIYLAPEYIGECETNSIQNTSLAFDISLIERYRRLNSIKEQPFMQSVRLYRKLSVFWPIYVVAPYFKVTFYHFFK